jgi:iron complex outermembrane receptor protein
MKIANKTLTLVVSLFLCALTVAAQQHSTVEWRITLTDLESRLARLPAGDSAALEQWRADAEALRGSIADFHGSHPEIRVTLPEPLPANPSTQALVTQLQALKAATDEVIRQSPGTPFNLGVVTVDVSAPSPAPVPVANAIDQTGIVDDEALNVAKAADLLPGVSIQHIANNRNEAGLMVRGFSTRGQVPFYLDGIPVYVPYDGYVDFNRFQTSDIAEIEVSRGYTSSLLGPNALGGSINLVTKTPTEKYDGDALIGTGSGDTLLSALRLGTRMSHFFAQGTLDWLQNDYVPLSGDFDVRQYTNLPNITMTDRLNQSNSRDEKFSGRLGWTPKASDEYVFSYSNQKGQKGVPLYQGPDTAAVFRNFWSWPYWNTDGYYFHSNTGIGESSSLKVRAFYNQFRNSINMYSNDTYTVMNTKSAEDSMYNEHTDGVSAEFDTASLARNAIGASFFFKDDTHTEHGIYPGMSPYPLVEPVLTDADRQISIGLEDSIKPGAGFRLTAGFSADHLEGVEGQSYNTALTGLAPFTCLASPANTSFSGCTEHVWNFNPQASISHALGESGLLFLTFADRGRFPMLKDIYSASLGAGLPNPDLKPEHSRNWNAGYSRLLGARTLIQAGLFRSDLRSAIESVYVTDPGGKSAATAYCPNSKIIGYCSQMANIGSEVHEGVEISVRSTPLARVTLSASYSYLNRDIAYHFGDWPNVSTVNTSITVLPTLPKNKVVAGATLRAPREILGVVNVRYEGGLTLQDTTYSSSSPFFAPFAESYATVDVGVIAPLARGVSAQAGVKNLLDRNYYYTAGYPEEGRNWYLNLRYRF